MNKILTSVTTAAMVAIIPGAHHLFGPRPTVAPHPQHVCTAEIIPFEDGSWAGGPLILDGKVLDAHWDRHMPKWSWTPGINGLECTLIISKSDGGRG